MDITSTEISALFGISPYITEYELWHQKKSGQIVEIEESERIRWGVRLQEAIANGTAEDEGWKIRPMNEYIRIPELRIGSSFDYCIMERVHGIYPKDTKQIRPGLRDTGILEVKNVDSLIHKEGWVVNDDGVEAPPAIELQLQHQLLISGFSYGYIDALVGGNRITLIKREPDLEVHEAIKQKSKLFWESIDNNEPPKPNFERDAEFIASLYNTSEPGMVIDAKQNAELTRLAMEYKHHATLESAAEAQKKAIKAQILMMIGSAEKVIGEGFSISAGNTKASIVESFERKAFRQFRINVQKSKG